MNKCYFYILVLVLFYGCEGLDRYSKKEFKGSRIVCDHVYMEYYRVFGSGAFGGDLLSAYLTDSTHFRKYLGTFDDAESGYSCDCRGDSIVVNKVIRNEPKIRKQKIEVLSLADLKRSGKFE